MKAYDFERMSRSTIQELLSQNVASIEEVLREFFEGPSSHTEKGIYGLVQAVRDHLGYSGFPAEHLSIMMVCSGGNSSLKVAFNAGRHGWINSN
jgi:hypothetical protein